MRRLLLAVALAAAFVSAPLVACAPPPAGDSGISGVVYVGPAEPVETAGTPSARPAALDLSVRSTVPFIGRQARVRSGENGRFSVDLEPGTYTIEPVRGQVPATERMRVVVYPGRYTQVTLQYDSGVR